MEHQKQFIINKRFMKSFQLNPISGITLLALFTFILFSSCGTDIHTAVTGTGQPTNTSSSIPRATAISTLGENITVQTDTTHGYPIKVYFSKLSSNGLTTVFPFDRLSPASNVGTFAIQQLIVGPTMIEKSQGYMSQVHDSITGTSTCLGSLDFTLSLNKRGPIDEYGTATVKFCRKLASAGIGTDARIQSEIGKTLTQFSTIQKVVILSFDNHCFGDESGLDNCLKK